MNDAERRYDLVVIGSGAAGHHGAIQAAKLGKRVAVIEQRPALGGASINTGTIPSKTLREAVVRLSRPGPGGGRDSDGYADPQVMQQYLTSRIEQVASNEVRVFEDQFRRNGVDTLIGRASFTGSNLIRIENREGGHLCYAERVLIATGTRPAHHESVPIDGVSILDTDAIRNLPSHRRVLTIVGGGVIGMEYACMAASVGISATLVERRPQILEFVDRQIVEALSYHMRSQGVIFRLGEEVDQVS